MNEDDSVPWKVELGIGECEELFFEDIIVEIGDVEAIFESNEVRIAL